MAPYYETNFTEPYSNYTHPRCYLFDRVVEDIIYVVLCCCGIPGNLSVIFVVIRVPAMRSVTNVLLVNLAIGDLICLVPNVIFYLCRTFDLRLAHTKVVTSISILQILGIYISLNTLLMIGIERYLAVCKTLFHKARFANGKRNIIISLSVIWLLSITLHLPYTIQYYFHINTHEVATYSYVINFIIVISVTTFLYGRIIVTLKKTRKLGTMRARATAARERRVVILCLVTAIVSALCMVCWIAQGVIQILVFYVNVIEFPYWALCLAKISNYGLQANSGINPYIYNIVSSKYRRALRQACYCGKEKKKKRGTFSMDKHTATTSESGLLSESRSIHRNGVLTEVCSYELKIMKG